MGVRSGMRNAEVNCDAPNYGLRSALRTPNSELRAGELRLRGAATLQPVKRTFRHPVVRID